MIRYNCDLCGRDLGRGEDLRYVIKMEIYAAFDPTAVDEDDDRDHLQDIQDALERLDDLADDLDATASQRQAMQEAKDRVLRKAVRMHADKKKTRAAVMAEVKKATPDAAKIHAIIDAKSDKMRKLAHEVADELLAIHATPTPEQRAKAVKLMEEHMAKH